VSAAAQLAAEQAALLDSSELSGVPVKKRDEAIARLGLIKRFECFAAAAERNGRRRRDTLTMWSAARKIPPRTMRRWLRQYRTEGLLGLVDSRGGGKPPPETISPEAFGVFKAMYLTQQQRSVKMCWQNIRFINNEQQKLWRIPPLRTMQRLVIEQIPMFVRVLHREGKAAYEARCAPYVQIDPDSVEAGQVWVGDHSQFNCWVRHRGRWIRPWLTAWTDYRSRALVGWHVTAQPNQATILLAARRGLERYGPPESVKIDNGRDYDSEAWTGTTKARRRALKAGYLDEDMVAGLYAMMGVAVSFAIPYHPQSKPIERLFDTIDQQFTKTIATYCGKDTARRPEPLADLLKSDKAIAEAHSLVELSEMFGRYAQVYNNAAHSGRGMDGRSPAQVLSGRRTQRVLAAGVLDLLMQIWSGELSVGKNGVKFNGMWYGQYNAELMVHQGKKVRVSYDPDDLRQVRVYDAATFRLVVIAEQNRLIQYGAPVSDESLRTAMQQKGRALKIARAYKDSRLAANMDLTDLTLRAMEDAGEEPPKQRPPATLKPVRTPLDDQVAEHVRRELRRTVRKAAGSEAKTVLDLDFSALNERGPSHAAIDFDLSLLKDKPGNVDLGLWQDE